MIDTCLATSKAMMDAVQRLLLEDQTCCTFHDIITGSENNSAIVHGGGGSEAITTAPSSATEPFGNGRLNQSQIEAVKSCDAPLSLIWGPPGTSSSHLSRTSLMDGVNRDWKDHGGCRGPSKTPEKVSQ